MWSGVEKWVISHLFGSQASNVLKEAGTIEEVVAKVDKAVVEIKGLKPGESVTLDPVTETLFGETRTITVVIGYPSSTPNQ